MRRMDVGQLLWETNALYEKTLLNLIQPLLAFLTFSNIGSNVVKCKKNYILKCKNFLLRIA